MTMFGTDARDLAATLTQMERTSREKTNFDQFAAREKFQEFLDHDRRFDEFDKDRLVRGFRSAVPAAPFSTSKTRDLRAAKRARWIGEFPGPSKVRHGAGKHGYQLGLPGPHQGRRGKTERQMTAKIKNEMSVGITDEIKSALEVATEFAGIKASQFGRQAILEKLVRDGFLRHPMHVQWEAICNARENEIPAK